ncbi:hypothetical protein [Amycolatopsis vancoresmycina]|uniref:Uncharacterized protein n=1 Tax=Amycolatopsis vancoresmycina DSM 44592 TaxID=1292037 RepID=R1G5S3_9PSEU|nr:hypothetical protein [Amycolatopsis vancoresmycina]EOD66812.1 hypothetical protein H480_19583 [Amycolatopsis vancoresmycina DSM 44592]
MERAELVRELKSLRKGRGLQASRLPDRVGPVLRTACAVSEADGMVVIRAKVTARLSELSTHLPEDLRVAVLAAFAITAEARQPLYQDRVRWAASRVDRDPRTVRRRVDEAIELLAELAVGSPVAASPGSWHTASLTLALAESSLFEQHRVVADQDGLRSFSLATGGADGMVLYGGTLSEGTVELPRPLSRGETWEFAAVFKAQPGSNLVYVPRDRCEVFDLRVRFGKEGPPEVLTLDAAFERDIADPGYRGRLERVDSVGEVHLQFRHLTPGLVYGARWTERP